MYSHSYLPPRECLLGLTGIEEGKIFWRSKRQLNQLLIMRFKKKKRRENSDIGFLV